MLAHLLDCTKQKIRIHLDTIKDKTATKDKRIIAFDPKIGSENLGDWIISYYSQLQLRELFSEEQIGIAPIHVVPDFQIINSLSHYKYRIVCGTNLMTPHYEWYSNWKIPSNFTGYREIITFAVGWGTYCEEISERSRLVYNTILSKNGFHSVRDSYTEMKFHQMGIHNVINTGCVTLWNLTQEHCQKIPKHKCDRVITTITDYDTDETNDKLMLDILLDKYREVFVWLQGTADEKYLRKYHQIEKLNIIGNDLNSFNNILSQSKIDYVGTRLHAGIHAMNYGIRSIIIAIDNRAIEMGKDFNLPIILRNEIGEKLADKIDNDFETIIRLPSENIKKWKSQFRM